ncbi:pyridoxamine 5'-phosphate oxidase family protein [Anaeromyxobacter oryzisoli]|uniref:pyridoxamine 5'-phosphate oxidase family protein n=1 Tax=Anaeromyxobacter oryzisoli TaxID=2925408 RepID=UPI001F589EAD|nr:pyridoxamine 5'-phosphate oxidase family protein [Anaeromyxobacter sp. SG63]
MITETIRSVLEHEGPAAWVTQGPEGPHLVATWNSYIQILDDHTLAFPAGGYRKTEQNLANGSGAQMIIGAKAPAGIGFLLTGRAALEVDTPVHAQLRSRFPWCRAAVVFRVTQVEKVLG